MRSIFPMDWWQCPVACAAADAPAGAAAACSSAAATLPRGTGPLLEDPREAINPRRTTEPRWRDAALGNAQCALGCVGMSEPRDHGSSENRTNMLMNVNVCGMRKYPMPVYEVFTYPPKQKKHEARPESMQRGWEKKRPREIKKPSDAQNQT